MTTRVFSKGYYSFPPFLAIAIAIIASPQVRAIELCDNNSWLRISNDLLLATQKGDAFSYHEAMVRAEAFKTDCPDSTPVVEELIDLCESSFINAQTPRLSQSNTEGKLFKVDEASELLLKASNSKIMMLVSGVGAAVLAVGAPPVAAALGIASGISAIRSLSCERKAAKRLNFKGL